MLVSNVEVIELYGFARLILLDNNVLYTVLFLPTITKISLLWTCPLSGCAPGLPFSR